ncbi:efflux RND transporter permease subunit [Gloeobacter kilaueensis]|uniref:Heavy metal efflux pump, CzcA family n=1 Tax=Gloeobacter kilaueensis (strain ATCC BAA-2537 / CCAP 1431/1 / ULC 316 / JS1) TaxID=1183438 RepID=U5QH64_GLOK1|nr:CusA/CzcA family heavy metal efflux RND transporter [Gloeobacter kilaueensis]AGY58281.1 heavy metal efflux pump, CzcA family [Gloeobacter kilaueensis JS1]
MSNARTQTAPDAQLQTIPEAKGIARWVYSALRQRVLILALLLVVLGIGVTSLLKVKVNSVPDISNLQVTVTVNARGLAPQEVEQYVTYPVELNLQNLPRLQYVRSVSKYALSQVTAIFEDGTDIYWARQQVAERLRGVQEQFPAGQIDLELGPIATGLGEVLIFRVQGPGYSLMQLRDILDWQIAPVLRGVSGVDTVDTMGGAAKEYQVRLLPDKLRGYALTPAQVMDALRNSNQNAGGGYYVQNENQILIRGKGLLQNLQDIGQVVVTRTTRGIVRVRDVAEVAIGSRLSQGAITANGRGETVAGIVIMRLGENPKQVITRVQRKISELRPSLPPGVNIKSVYNQEDLIDRAIETVAENLAVGAALVVIILFLLLGSFRGGLVTAAAIPLSLVGAATFLAYTNTSGNLLSLGALDFGLLVDGSVVMVENIMRRLADNRPLPEERLAVVQQAAGEMARPVLFAVSIIIVVYLPILFLTGVAGKTFQPMALTVVAALASSLVVALFVTPVLAYFAFKNPPKEEETWVLRAIRYPYERLLAWCTGNRLWTAVIALGFFLVSLFPLTFLGAEFIPQLSEGSLVLSLVRPPASSLEAAVRQTSLIEKVLKEFPDIETTMGRTGRSETAFDPMGPDVTDFYVILKPRSEWKQFKTQDEIEEAIGKRLAEAVPGAAISIGQPIENRTNELIAGAKADVAVRLYGPDLDQLKKTGDAIAQTVGTVSGAVDVVTEKVDGLPSISAQIDRSKLAAYGISTQAVMETVEASVSGKVVGKVFQGRPRYNLVVRFAPSALPNIESLANLPVATTSGQLIPLSSVARVAIDEGPAQISHRSGERVLTVQMNVRGRDLGGFVADAQKAVESKVALPSGYRIEWGGEFENLQEAQGRLFVLVPLTLVLIFILLYSTYGSFRPGVLIFLNVPLALSGGLLALALRSLPLSVTAGVGFIALFGVAVLNGVVLVSTIRKLEEEGLPAEAAAQEGARERLRPVLMTALVASLGFVPMALATGPGAEVQRPLATVVIGGLITATLLTLLVLPALYPVICGRDGFKLLWRSKDRRHSASSDAP